MTYRDSDENPAQGEDTGRRDQQHPSCQEQGPVVEDVVDEIGIPAFGEIGGIEPSGEQPDSYGSQHKQPDGRPSASATGIPCHRRSKARA